MSLIDYVLEIGQKSSINFCKWYYQAFFKWVKKRSGVRKSPPKFRPFIKYKSFTLKQARWKLNEENGKVKIGKTWYRYHNNSKREGVAKTISIKRDSVGDWFIIISCDLRDDFVPEKNCTNDG